MICGFKQKFKDETPTYFAEKIRSRFTDPFDFISLLDNINYNDWFYFNYQRNIEALCRSKITTIREDKNDRWKVGMRLQPSYNVRTKKQFQFAPDIIVKGIQTIKIQYSTAQTKWVIVDGRVLSDFEVKTLATNDGFKNVRQFFEWFNKDFKGKIIHFTDLKY